MRLTQRFPPLCIAAVLSAIGFAVGCTSASALPSPEDTPEEVLRTQIITEARSPVNGKPLTAAEYAELQAQLQAQPVLRSTLSPQIRDTIFLLQIRRTIRTFLPFVPIP
jgi:hypothetical protein